MGGLLGGGRATKPTPPATNMRVQSAIAGKPIPILYGRQRFSTNLIWYGDFASRPASSGGKGGGKGGGGSGGKGGGGSYDYSAYVILALCEGPASVVNVWDTGSPVAGSSQTPVPEAESLASVNLTAFDGDYAQAAWSWLVSNHPDQAIPYRGLTHVAGGIQLGGSATLPSWTFEVQGDNVVTYNYGLDCVPGETIADFLTNANYGVGFPAAYLGSFANYNAMCIAANLLISDVLVSQVAANSWLGDLLAATNAEFVWSSGLLTIVPYGDTGPVSVPGYSYTPPSAPLFSLGDDDFMKNTGGTTIGVSAYTSGDPLICVRKRRSDALNDIKVEYLDRNAVYDSGGVLYPNAYNPTIAEAMDEAAIDTWGLRPSDTRQMHFFCYAAAAITAAQLQLRRQQVLNQYTFTLDQRYAVLDPMDLVAVTDAALGLDAAPVLIKEITENQDSTLTFVAEEWLGQAGTIPLYGLQANAGYVANYNAAPPPMAAPIIWEPTERLARSPEIWVAVTGPAGWGGCEVWVSNDNETYTAVTQVVGGARMGALTALLGAVGAATSGPTLDETDVLAVDVSEGANSQLLSGSVQDALNANTLCYVNGEYLAYETAQLTGAGRYTLSYLNRGLYGSAPGAHAAGAPFVRLDGAGLARVPYSSDRIGQTIWLKFVSFNAFEGGGQTLADVQGYPYVVQGTSFHAPPADVTGLNTVYLGALAYLTWQDVSDTRPIRYEVRQGAQWLGAQVIASAAHGPVRVQGDGTYWVAAVASAPDGTTIYSANPPDVSVQGSVLTANVIASYDEKATGWTGSFGGTAVVSGGIVETSSSGNVLAITDWLNTPNVLNIGGQASGTYEIPAGHEIDIGRVAACNVVISWQGQGQPAGQNVLAIADWLNTTDILGWDSTANTDIFPEIALSQDGTSWGAWQRYQAGSYLARKFKARMQIQTSDPATQALLEAFTFAVDVPTRIDHFLGLSVAAGGTAVTFRPDGGATAAFNGGPVASSLPTWRIAVLNAASGDTVIVSGLSLSGATIQVQNAGAGVARTVNAEFEGY